MADIGGSSSAPSQSTNSKPVIVRVKRKAFQSRLEAFWLEINERPVKRAKRPLLDFEKLSISDSSGKVMSEELKAKKVFVQHVETVSSSEVTVDILQSFVPNSAESFEYKTKSEERRRTFKKENKQDQLLFKAKQKQGVLAKNARFEQVWRSRKGNKEAMPGEALHGICHLYDVVRVDVEETINDVQDKDISLEDHRIMWNYLPLLREFIPSAAAEIESDIHAYMSKQASTDDYVYDFYTVKNDTNITCDDALNPFPLVQVDDDDGFYDGPVESEFESDDSNAEDNPLNEYPDEETSEDEEDLESGDSDNETEELESESATDKSPEPEDLVHRDLSEDADPLYEDETYGDFDYGDGDGDGDGDDEDWRWSYR